MKEYAKGFYKSAAWKRARQQVITRSNGLCERCKARGIYKPGYIVHHKEYITPGNISNPKNAYLMIHKPWCDCEGNANELRKMADTLEAIEAGIWSIYEEHLAEGVTIEQIKELMEAETWLSGEEAAKYFNVSVGEENTAVAAVQDYTKLYCKNTPEALAGGNPPDDTKDQAAAKEKEIRSKIAALTIKHME